MEEVQLTKLIEGHVQECWKDNSTPVLFSQLGPWLTKQGINYKQLIGEKGLRAFLLEAGARLDFVQHPTQKAKTGAVPLGVEFSFADAQEDTALEKSRSLDTRKAFYMFIKAVSHLPSEEQDKVILPTSVIVRLLERK